jgi:hypothetical protein
MKKHIGIFVGVCMITLIAITLVGINPSYGQCNLKFEAKVEKPSGSGNSDILIKLEQGSGNIDFYLIDLNKPQNGPLQKTQKSASELRNDFVVVFRNVQPSNYTIQAIDNNKCQVSIGGLEGITISSN